ncbi:AAA family ATPase [Desulfofundulus thermocisternus]|nr:AAA family ATPase [Desulfofundulus thermocisternus]
MRGKKENKTLKDEWMTCEEVAELEGISVRAVQARCARKTLPCKKIGGVWKINRLEYEHQKGKFLVTQKKQILKSENSTVKSALVFANAKGGVGKTTLSVVTADKLSLLGYKVLLVDMDPQGNATTFAGLQPYRGTGRPGNGEYKEALHDVLLGQVFELFGMENKIRTRDAIYPARGFYVLPTDNRAERIKYWLLDNAHAFSTGMDLYNVWTEHFPFLLKNALKEVEKDFDFFIIDTPPEMGWATTNAMMCATDIVIPIELGNFEVAGLEMVFTFIDQCAVKNPKLKILGIVISRYGPHRSRLDIDLEDQLRKHEIWGPFVFQTIIYRTLLVREATNAYKSVFEYWRKGMSRDSLQSLDEFTDELIMKLILNNKGLDNIEAGEKL